MATKTDTLKIKLEVDGQGNVKAQLADVADGIEDIDDKSKRAKNSAAQLKGAIAGIITAQSLRMLVEANVEYQRLEAILKTSEGTAAAAAKRFDELKEFAKTTPFQLNEVVQAFVTMKNLGLDPTMETMRDFGNVAAAQGKSLQQVAEAVADATVGEFERLKEFGIKARKEGEKITFSFKGVETEIGNSSREIQSYLRGIGQENFATAMADQMDTLGGKFSNLQDAVFQFAAAIGEAGLSDVVGDVTSGATTIINDLTAWLEHDPTDQYQVAQKSLSDWRSELSKLMFEQDELNRELSKPAPDGWWGSLFHDAEETEKELAEVDKRIRILIARIAHAEKTKPPETDEDKGPATVEPSPAEKKAREEAEKLIAVLEKQAATYGMAKDELILYQAEQLAAAVNDEELAAAVRASAQAVADKIIKDREATEAEKERREAAKEAAEEERAAEEAQRGLIEALEIVDPLRAKAIESLALQTEIRDKLTEAQIRGLITEEELRQYLEDLPGLLERAEEGYDGLSNSMGNGLGNVFTDLLDSDDFDDALDNMFDSFSTWLTRVNEEALDNAIKLIFEGDADGSSGIRSLFDRSSDSEDDETGFNAAGAWMAAGLIAGTLIGTELGGGGATAQSGASTGAAVGSIWGPWGAIIGAIVGGYAGGTASQDDFWTKYDGSLSRSGLDILGIQDYLPFANTLNKPGDAIMRALLGIERPSVLEISGWDTSDQSKSDSDQVINTLFGDTYLRTRRIKGDDLNDIVTALEQFDAFWQDQLTPAQIDEITASLAAWGEKMKGADISVDDFLASRLSVILDTAAPEYKSYITGLDGVDAQLAAYEAIRFMEDFNGEIDMLKESLATDELSQFRIQIRQSLDAETEAWERLNNARTNMDPVALAEAAQEAAQATIRRYQAEIQLVQQLTGEIAAGAAQNRAFRLEMDTRLSALTGDYSQILDTLDSSRESLRANILNEADTERALSLLGEFVATMDRWLAEQRAAVDRWLSEEFAVLDQEHAEILAAAAARTDARLSAIDNETAAVERQLSLAQEWLTVLDQAERLIDNLLVSSANPLSAYGRLDLLGGRIEATQLAYQSSTGSARVAYAQDLMSMLQERLDLAGDLYQRPSTEYVAFYNDTLAQLHALQAEAEEGSDTAESLQRRLVDLQAEANELSSEQLLLTAAERNRLAEIEAERTALQEEANARLEAIEAQALADYEWAKTEGERLQAERHAELTALLNEITGGLDPESFIAQQQERAADLLEDIRDSLDSFLGTIREEPAEGSSYYDPAPGYGTTPSTPVGPLQPIGNKVGEQKIEVVVQPTITVTGGDPDEVQRAVEKGTYDAVKRLAPVLKEELKIA